MTPSRSRRCATARSSNWITRPMAPSVTRGRLISYNPPKCPGERELPPGQLGDEASRFLDFGSAPVARLGQLDELAIIAAGGSGIAGEFGRSRRAIEAG